MTLPESGGKGTPRERFRDILSAEQADQSVPAPRKPAVVNLPRPRAGEQGAEPDVSTGTRSDVESFQSVRPFPKLQSFWTVGAILSIIANVVLLSLFLTDRSPGAAAGVLPAVYDSLQQIENAHIRVTVPVDTNLVLDATVPVKTVTRLVLRSDLVVRGAHVTINGSGLSIDSPADIVLPAGTELDANLEMALPLQSALPMTAEVPVDISIRETELLGGIESLKEALRPLVCASKRDAKLSDGTPICR